MDDLNSIISERLLELPEKARIFVLNPEWIKRVKNVLSKFNLSENAKTMIEYSVLNIMIGFLDPENITNDIIEKTGIDKNIAEWITESIEKEILEPYSDLFPEENITEIEDTKSLSPNSYEQIVANQKKAMRPIGIEEEKSINYESTRIMNKNIPDNLPTGETHYRSLNNYGQNNDPYREPID